MMPKEKAIDLISRFLESDKMVFNIEGAKECALIAVDEIINNSLEYMGCTPEDGEITYWQEVKQEIIRL